MKRKKILTLTFVILVIVLLGGLFTHFYLYRPHRNVANEKASVTVSAKTLAGNFTMQTDENWTDKVVELNGKVSAIENETTLIIDDQVQVDLDIKQSTNGIMLGSMITLKGRCVGYDDLLDIVKVDQAIILINN